MAENVDLIKTIPPRFKDGLAAKVQQTFLDEPFNQQVMKKLFAEEGKSAGYNLKRITRDQNNKLTGQLTQVRQQQLGIQAYTWNTSEDERVRPSHISKNGVTFEWSKPPPDTGHPGNDIMCRCVAGAVVTSAVQEKLGSTAPTSGVDIEPQPVPGVTPGLPPTTEAPFEFWNDPQWRAGRTKNEIEWHSVSWPAAVPNYLLRAVSKRKALNDVKIGTAKTRAHFSSNDNLIKMNGPKKVALGTESSQSTWRHEFGHAVDFGEDSLKPVISQRPSFQAAYESDNAFLGKAPGLLDQTATARAAVKIKDLPDVERARTVTETLQRAGLDEADVRTFMKKNSVLGYEGEGALTVAESDALVWYFAKSWETGDVMGMLKSISTNFKSEFFRGLGFGESQVPSTSRFWKIYRYYLNVDHGVAKALSDAMDGASRGFKNHLWTHGEGYYRKRNWLRGTELVANQISILGSGPFGEKLLRKVLPALTEDLVNYLKAVP